jgi:excisionase family DNA binding protein
MDGGLSIQDAAHKLGISEKTVRRRIKAGTLTAAKVEAVHGFEWRVYLDDQSSQAPVQSPPAAVQTVHDNVQIAQEDVQSPHVSVQPTQAPQPSELLKALELLDQSERQNRELQRENTQLAGQVGFLQARTRELETQIKLLTTTKEPEPLTEAVPAPDESRASWWRRLLRRRS